MTSGADGGAVITPKKQQNKRVLERAKRLARNEVSKELGRFSRALGLGDDYDPAKLEAKIQELQRGGGQPDEATKALMAQVADLKAQQEKQQRELAKERERAERAERNAKDVEVEAELKEYAMKAGVRDSKYALHLFAEHVQSGAEDVDPEKFFEGLKADKTKRYLFAEETVLAGPTTPTPEQKVETAPAPANPAAPKEEDLTERDDKGKYKTNNREFAERTSAKYGFRPSVRG